MASSAAARPTSGCEPAPSPSVTCDAHLHDALGLGHGQRLRVGVGDDEVDALQARRDHVVDRVAAGAADAEHGNARLHLTNVGNLQIDAHGLPLHVTGVHCRVRHRSATGVMIRRDAGQKLSRSHRPTFAM